ncbi:MAG: CHAT domain-containing protein [Candidatus Krumholzibacteriota bacterium]|nr:CHAT domain-containing protein [Candidatus Krumholzibacteriota bacterium]
MKRMIPVFLSLLLLNASVSAAQLPANSPGGKDQAERLKEFESLARRLDTGKNSETVEYCLKLLRDDPGSIIASDALIKARSRFGILDSDRLLKAVSADNVDPGEVLHFRSFIRSVLLKRSRDFEGAAEGLSDAGSGYLAAGDGLSALICFIEGIKSQIGARNSSGAELLVKKARDCLSRLPYQKRIDLEILSLEAEIANISDDLSTADSLFSFVLENRENHQYRQIKAYCLSGRGRLNEKRQKFQEASGYYLDALKEYERLGAIENQAIILNNMGQVMGKLGDNARSSGYLKEAEEKAESIGSMWLLGFIDYGLGAIAETQGNKGKAREYFRRSLDNHLGSGNTWGELGARLRLAYIQVLDGEYSEAIRHYEHAVSEYEKMKSLYGLNWALAGMALAKHRFGDLAGAEEYYRRAYELKVKLGDLKGAAWCLNSTGMVCDLGGRYREALTNEFEAMKIYREIGDLSGEGEAHFSIGSAYYYLGNYQASIEHYEKAKEIAASGNNIDLLKRVASGMGSIYMVSGRFDLAEKYYLEYLETAIKTDEAGDLIWANNNLASHYIAAGDIFEAKKYIQENRKLISAENRDSLYGIRALYLEGMACADRDSSIFYLDQSVSMARVKGLEELRWKCLSELGDRYREKKDFAMARECFEEAVRTVESLRFMTGSGQFQRHMLRSAITPYERIVALLLDSEDDGNGTLEAFGYMERSRAWVLAARLRKARTENSFDDGKGADEEELELVSRLSFLQKRLQEGGLKDDERKKMNSGIERIEEDFRKLQLRKAGGSDWRISEVCPEFEEPEELLSALYPGELLLSYFLGIERSYLVSISGGMVKYYTLPGRSEIEKKAGYFLSLFKTGGDRRSAGGEGNIPAHLVERAQRQIYDLLLRPAEGDIRAGDRLVIIPDGLLGRVSFSMLRSASGYLGDSHQIFYTPSLRTLFYLRNRPGEMAGDVERLHEMISFGYRGQSEQFDSKRVYPFTDIPVQNLPNAEREAVRVASFFNKSLVITGKDASERRFKNAPIGMISFLHCAAHSHVDDDNPRRSFIVLEPDSPGPDSLASVHEDGLLQWREIASLDLVGTFVSLSACSSAGGEISYGEGILGLAQAFIHAGSRCVLASLTDVPDSFAEKFMVSFYERVTGGSSPSEALRQLGPEARGWDEVEGNPGLWASFILTGDGVAENSFSK